MRPSTKRPSRVLGDRTKRMLARGECRARAVSEVHAKALGRELRGTRRELGLTQAEQARRLGVSPSYIAAVEAGRHNLTLGQIANIANAMRLGVSVSFIRPDGTPVGSRPQRRAELISLSSARLREGPSSAAAPPGETS